MRLRPFKRSPRYRRLIMLSGALLLLALGGCPIDGDKLTTDVVQASLQSITDSIVDTLSAYLAKN